MVAMARSQGRETMEDNSPRRRKSESETMSDTSSSVKSCMMLMLKWKTRNRWPKVVKVSSRKEKITLTRSADSQMANLCSSHLPTCRLLSDKSTQEVAIGQMAVARNESCDIFQTI